MKGTIIDFLQMAANNQALARELVELAARHGFQFDADQLQDADLAQVSGGVDLTAMRAATSAAIADSMMNRAQSSTDLASDLYKATTTMLKAVNDQLYQTTVAINRS